MVSFTPLHSPLKALLGGCWLGGVHHPCAGLESPSTAILSSMIYSVLAWTEAGDPPALFPDLLSTMLGASSKTLNSLDRKRVARAGACACGAYRTPILYPNNAPLQSNIPVHSTQECVTPRACASCFSLLWAWRMADALNALSEGSRQRTLQCQRVQGEGSLLALQRRRKHKLRAVVQGWLTAVQLECQRSPRPRRPAPRTQRLQLGMCPPPSPQGSLPWHRATAA